MVHLQDSKLLFHQLTGCPRMLEPKNPTQNSAMEPNIMSLKKFSVDQFPSQKDNMETLDQEDSTSGMSPV